MGDLNNCETCNHSKLNADSEKGHKRRVVIRYGSGFAGNEYYLMVGATYYLLWKNCGGSHEDEKEVHAHAIRILQEKHKDIPVDDMEDKFEWNGLM